MSSIMWTVEAFGNDVCLVMDMLTHPTRDPTF
jgi:hypothetical protein